MHLSESNHSTMDRSQVIIIFALIGFCAANNPTRYSGAVDVCQRQFKNNQIGTWRPRHLHKDTLPVCKDKLVFTGADLSLSLLDLEKSICISEELELIVDNCPLAERYFRQIARLSGLPLEGSGGRLLQLSIQRCFSTVNMVSGRYDYLLLFRCIADQEKIMKGSMKLFETREIIYG